MNTSELTSIRERLTRAIPMRALYDTLTRGWLDRAQALSEHVEELEKTLEQRTTARDGYLSNLDLANVKRQENEVRAILAEREAEENLDLLARIYAYNGVAEGALRIACMGQMDSPHELLERIKARAKELPAIPEDKRRPYDPKWLGE